MGANHGLTNPLYRHCVRTAGVCSQIVSNRVFMTDFICGKSEILFGTCASAGYTCEKDKTEGTSGWTDSMLYKMISVGVSDWLLPTECEEDSAVKDKGMIVEAPRSRELADLIQESGMMDEN